MLVGVASLPHSHPLEHRHFNPWNATLGKHFRPECTYIIFIFYLLNWFFCCGSYSREEIVQGQKLYEEIRYILYFLKLCRIFYFQYKMVWNFLSTFIWIWTRWGVKVALFWLFWLLIYFFFTFRVRWKEWFRNWCLSLHLLK